MTRFPLGAFAAALLSCALLSACQQAGTSTFNGRLGSDPLSEQTLAKREAARERAGRKAKEAREAFLKEREERRAERAARSGTGDEDRNKAETSSDDDTVTAYAARKSKRSKGPEQAIEATKAAFAGARVATNAKPWDCVPGQLKTVLGEVSRKFGPVEVNSTHRSSGNNRRVGGRKGSYHLRCAAVDFRVRGSSKGLTRFLANHKLVGGYKRYSSGFYHIDTGPKRTW